LIDRTGSYGLTWFGVSVLFLLAAGVTIRWWSGERRPAHGPVTE
jgi:cytochrome oxidase assembly protein ShyY1